MHDKNLTFTDQIYAALRAAGLDFFVSVPCKLLGELIVKLADDPNIIYTPVSREEEGVGMACGAFLSGRHPAIVMQNSGFGNSINAIMALLNYYRIPVVFVVSHRGSPGEPIEAQKMMGNVICDLLDLVDIEVLDLKSPGQIAEVPPAIAQARMQQRSIAVLLPFSFWSATE